MSRPRLPRYLVSDELRNTGLAEELKRGWPSGCSSYEDSRSTPTAEYSLCLALLPVQLPTNGAAWILRVVLDVTDRAACEALVSSIES